MKGKFTFLKISLVGLFLITAMGVSAQVTPETPSVTFFCNESSTTLQAPSGFDNYTWFLENGGGAPQPLTGRISDTLVVDQTGNYYVQVWMDEDGCKSDLSAAFPVFEAPALAVTISSTDPDLRYCTEDAGTGITLNATLTSPDPIPHGLTVQYQWYSADDATGSNPVAVGTNQASYDVNVSLTDPTVREKLYYFVTVTYVEATTCEAPSNTLEVTVDPKPTTPVISLM